MLPSTTRIVPDGIPASDERAINGHRAGNRTASRKLGSGRIQSKPVAMPTVQFWTFSAATPVHRGVTR